MTKHIRVDELGGETLFHVVDALIEDYAHTHFRAYITHLALGYTRYAAIGGWKGIEEQVTIYRVASLSPDQRNELIEFLLRHSRMQDVYVVHPDGVAHGYCYEETAPKLTLTGAAHNGYPD